MPKPPEPKLARLKRERDTAKADRDRHDAGWRADRPRWGQWLEANRVYEQAQRAYAREFSRVERAAAKERGR